MGWVAWLELVELGLGSVDDELRGLEVLSKLLLMSQEMMELKELELSWLELGELGLGLNQCLC